MKWYDITLEIRSNMVVWPGDPQVRIESIQKIADGAKANVSQICMGLHTGTHVDAPYHFLDEGVKLSQISLDRFFGPVQVIEIPSAVDRITADELAKIDPVQFSSRILFKTRNSYGWSNTVIRFDKHFVAVEEDAAQFLVDRGVQLVGIDGLSIAPFGNGQPTHQVLLGQGVIILEGLNLQGVPAGGYQLYCLPLKLGDAEGAPARAILIDTD